ncbi:HalOD1 output domain-containing protein [Natronolimnobius baerhuensis]|uniref:HalOD1 output domain-containing protein n=1 Tax=Natronolimnobius baerhuensis TaxID=253108 RepID=UPI0006D06FA6
MNNQNCGGSQADNSVVIESEIHHPESLVESIVRGVSICTNTPQAELTPLYEYVDPEPLAAVLEHARQHDSDVTFEFKYEGCRITLSQENDLRVRHL